MGSNNHPESGTGSSMTSSQSSTCTPTEVNPCVYSTKEKPLLIMTIFVHDGLGCCVQNSKLDKMINHLEQVFEVSKSYADVYVRFTHLT
jgi:hypothetical protein